MCECARPCRSCPRPSVRVCVHHCASACRSSTRSGHARARTATTWSVQWAAVSVRATSAGCASRCNERGQWRLGSLAFCVRAGTDPTVALCSNVPRGSVRVLLMCTCRCLNASVPVALTETPWGARLPAPRWGVGHTAGAAACAPLAPPHRSPSLPHLAASCCGCLRCTAVQRHAQHTAHRATPRAALALQFD